MFGLNRIKYMFNKAMQSFCIVWVWCKGHLNTPWPPSGRWAPGYEWLAEPHLLPTKCIRLKTYRPDKIGEVWFWPLLWQG